MADQVGAAPATERKPEGVNYQRLSASGLPGEQVEPRAEPDARFRDEGEVADL